MIEVSLELRPNILTEIVPGVSIFSQAGEPVTVTVKLDKMPAAGRHIPGAVPVVLASERVDPVPNADGWCEQETGHPCDARKAFLAAPPAPETEKLS